MRGDTPTEVGPLVESTHDFDLHGIVGIRLLDATPADVAKVQRQLGPLRKALDRDPDITVRFVDTATERPVTCVGLGQTGFNDDGFFVLQGKDGVSAKARIPFDRIALQPEIVCERAMPSVPHLLAIINLTALSKGVLPLHASAFTTDATGVLVTGWAKSGKTESLLACMSQGAQYVGDEWVYLTEDGQMRGVPEPIRLWAWHLDQMPELLKTRSRRQRLGLAAWKRTAALALSASRSRLPGSALFRKGTPIIARQAYLQIPPAELFGPSALALQGMVDVVILVLSHESPEIVIEATTAGEVSGRMAASLADERAAIAAHYQQFRYAFPELRSAALDGAPETEAKLLAQFLDDRPAAKVLHPYPCDIAALGQAVMTAAHATDRRGDPSRAHV